MIREVFTKDQNLWSLWLDPYPVFYDLCSQVSQFHILPQCLNACLAYTLGTIQLREGLFTALLNISVCCVTGQIAAQDLDTHGFILLISPHLVP